MTHSDYLNERKLVVDMMQLGIPPRPETELIEEITLSQKAQIDGQYYDKLEKMRDQFIKDKEELNL